MGRAIKGSYTLLDQGLAESLPAFFTAVIAQTRPVIRQHFQKSFSVEQKADASPVTIADRKIERIIRDMLCQNFPDHHSLGEEFGASFTDGASHTDANPTDGYCWVIDPIDGTRAFISGKPSFGTLLALCCDGVPLAGMIDMPILDETYIGLLGAEPETRLNGQIIQVSHTDQLAKASIATTSPEAFTDAGWHAYRPFSQRCFNQLYGGDCHNYALLAAGHLDLVVEHNLAAHDVMALVPIILGAGGVASDWSGAPLTLNSSDEIIAAASPALQEAAIKALS